MPDQGAPLQHLAGDQAGQRFRPQGLQQVPEAATGATHGQMNAILFKLKNITWVLCSWLPGASHFWRRTQISRACLQYRKLCPIFGEKWEIMRSYIIRNWLLKIRHDMSVRLRRKEDQKIEVKNKHINLSKLKSSNV